MRDRRKVRPVHPWVGLFYSEASDITAEKQTSAGASVDWDAARKAYASSDETVAAICSRIGITSARLYAQARREGWPKRRQRSGKDRAKCKAKRGMALAARRRLDLIARLYEATERKLTMLEARIADTPAASAMESEREARALGALVRTFEKLTEFEDRARKSVSEIETDAEHDDTTAAAADAERWRKEIAQRLARITAIRES